METRSGCRVWAGKHLGKWPLGGLRRSWRYNIEMNLQDGKWMYGTVWWWTWVLAVLNLLSFFIYFPRFKSRTESYLCVRSSFRGKSQLFFCCVNKLMDIKTWTKSCQSCWGLILPCTWLRSWGPALPARLVSHLSSLSVSLSPCSCTSVSHSAPPERATWYIIPGKILVLGAIRLGCSAKLPMWI